MAATATKLWRFQTPLLDRACRVVFAGPHFQAGLLFARQRLEKQRQQQQNQNQRIELIHAPTTEELMQLAPTADVALPFMQRFDAHFMQRAQQLRLVMQFGVGLEGVDVAQATAQGVAVSNIPATDTGNAQATAEHALFLSISLLRKSTHELPRRFQEGELGGLPIPQALYRKRVTVVGYGAVGSTVCRYLGIMGAHVTAVRRSWEQHNSNNRQDPTIDLIQRSTSLEQILPTTDLLILACTMTPETFHLMNQHTVALLPKGALVVNVGRGPLVEYDAIWQGLQSGHIGGFASDVGVGHATKASEPWDPTDPLSQHPNAVFTPHVGGYTDYSYGIMADKVLKAVENVVQGKPPDVWVNRDD